MHEGPSPDLEALAACGLRVASAMGQPTPDPALAAAFFEKVLFTPQDLGGRDLWGCLREGIITEVEVVNATIARFATWVSQHNKVSEPPSSSWMTPEIARVFETALFGRAACA